MISKTKSAAYLYLRNIPIAFLASVLASCLYMALIWLLGVRDADYLMDSYLMVSLSYILFSQLLLFPHFLFVYLPAALYWRKAKYRVVILPILGFTAYSISPVIIDAIGGNSLNDLEFGYWFTNSTGFAMGLFHHFLMKRE